MKDFSQLKEEIACGLLKIGAVFLRPEEPFTWASGIKSPIYCDNRLILTEPKLRDLVETALEKLIREEFSDMEILMGTATAGIPHAAIVADRLGVAMGYIRGKSKDHGRNNQIEGRLDKGAKGVVVEDLISTGGSSIDAAKTFAEAGGQLLGIVSIFTYGMKESKIALERENILSRSLLTLDELLEYAVKEGYISSEQSGKILKFRDDPKNEAWMKGI